MQNLHIPPRLPTENHRQYAYRVLFDAIMSLELEPGGPLSDAELSEMLGVSRTPVREAIMALAEAKLVEIYPQRSSCVSHIHLDYVEEGVFLRQAAECAALAKAVDMAGASDISRLMENLLHQKNALADERFYEYVKLDNQFHELVFLAAGKPWSWQAVARVSTHLDRVRLLQIRAGSATLLAGYEEHCQLFERIATRQGEDASDFFHRHLTAGYRTALPYLLEHFPGYFSG